MSEIELSVLCIPRVTNDVDETVNGLAAQMRTSPEIVREMLSVVIGSVEAIVEKLQRECDKFNLSYSVPGSLLDAVTPVVRQLAGR